MIAGVRLGQPPLSCTRIRILRVSAWGPALTTSCRVQVFYTGFVVAVNEVAKNGSNYMDPEVAAALSPDEVATAVYGSKMVLAMELCTLTTVWLVKACLLFLYYRLTKEAYEKQKLAVKLIAVFCGVGYILVVTLLLTHWCHPIEEYWSVPVTECKPLCSS